ncbi:MAG TPA: hypothetical protein VJR87_10415 [Allosphingosinicella sp.]|nr:hypothetical protein [Allosphingosinicella sp.]
MDRRRARASALIPILLLAGASHAPDIPIREARWIAPDARYRQLTREPAECLVMPRDQASRRSVAIGRSLFRAPLLLGGQAARAGMSCATCHRNGRGNPDFLFPGVSGARGTADVTSSLMSSRRGDQVANPKPIPDLGNPDGALKVSRDAQGRALEHFIHGLVVEEFDGAEPPPEALAALAAYVRALRPEGCRGRDRPIRLAARLAEVDEAVDLARGSEGGTRRLLLAAARSTLGAIDERFQLSGLEEDRRLLLAADRDLQAIRLHQSDFARWDRDWPQRRRRLLSDEPRSLFSPGRVRQALR